MEDTQVSDEFDKPLEQESASVDVSMLSSDASLFVVPSSEGSNTALLDVRQALFINQAASIDVHGIIYLNLYNIIVSPQVGQKPPKTKNKWVLPIAEMAPSGRFAMTPEKAKEIGETLIKRANKVIESRNNTEKSENSNE